VGNRPALLAALALHAALFLCWSPAARADPPAQRRAALHLHVPPDTGACMAEDALASAVTERLKRPVFVMDKEADVIVDAQVEPIRASHRWRALIKLTTPSGAVLGTREIQSKEASCRSLDESLVLVIALLIDPDVALGLAPSVPPEAPPALPSEPGPPVAPPAPPKPSEKSPPPRPLVRPKPAPSSLPLRFHAEMGAVLALGLVPGLGVGAIFRATLTPPHFWGIQVEGTYWPQHSFTVDDVGGGFTLAYGGLGLCPSELEVRMLRLAGCGGVKVGAFTAQGFGFDASNTQSSLLVNASLEGRARLRLPNVPMAVSLGLGLGVPLIRLKFFYGLPDGSTRELYRPSQAIGTLDLGIGIDVP